MSAMRMPTRTKKMREAAIDAAAAAITRGELVVMPTDTVYGVAADAFKPEAVAALLAAKGRGRQMPPPVLVNAPGTLDALAVGVPEYAKALVAEFWPGALTIIARQQPSLLWDLGETKGTVAVRMPDHPIALALLERTGPLAVSSANLTGLAAATDAGQAEEMLGESVAVILDAGNSPGSEASTILDVTGEKPRVMRWGALHADDLNRILTTFDVALEVE